MRKTPQEYIDETPMWADGTKVLSTPMTRMQWRIWYLATAGKFFEGLVVFMTGVALPLIVSEFHLGPMQKGTVGAASLAGILVGATALGGLSDLYGRKKIFIAEMAIFAFCLVMLVFCTSYAWLLTFLFGMGLALGCDYPTAHMVISESIPTKDRGKLVLGAFAFQAVGAIAGTAIGYLILYKNPDLGAWRWMYATAVVPAIAVVIARFFIPDSGHWLMANGRVAEAERELLRLLNRRPPYPKKLLLAHPAERNGNSAGQRDKGYAALFKSGNLRATILASVPWFLQDLSTYGIGIFTPTILAAALGAKTQHVHNIATLIHNDMLAAKGAAFIDTLLLFGIIGAILLVDKVGRIRLQVFGFIGCAVGLFIGSTASGMAEGPERIIVLFTGFMLFSLMTNIGPNATTYLLAGEVFPTRLRGKGAGFAASFGKVGAVATAFLFPVLLKTIGPASLLYILMGASLLGALVTWLFRIETKGRSLEELDRQ